MVGVRLIKTEHAGAVKLVGMMRDRLVYKWGTEVLSLHPPLPRNNSTQRCSKKLRIHSNKMASLLTASKLL